MNILILGGTGSIGQALTELLKNTAWNVYVTTRTRRENVQNITFLQGISKQFLDLTLCNSANGGKACIYGLFRHLLYGRTIRI